MDGHLHLLNYFNDISTNDLKCDKELYKKIDKMFVELRRIYPHYISPGYLKDTIDKATEVFKNKCDVKWNVTLYVCDNINYEIVFWCKNASNTKYFVDKFGYIYSSEKIFLSTLNFRKYYTHNDEEINDLDYNPRLRLSQLEDDIKEIFGTKGQELLTKFCNAFGITVGDININFKTIFPLFKVLLTNSLPEINFIRNNLTSFTIQIGTTRNEIQRDGVRDFRNMEYHINCRRYKIFDKVKKFVENSRISSAFSPHCGLIFEEICVRFGIWYNVDGLENYKWCINKRFICDSDHAEGCHQIAYNLLGRAHAENAATLTIRTLNELKFLIFWIRYKTLTVRSSDADETRLNFVAGSKLKVEKFFTQFRRLHDVVYEIHENLTPKFRNSYSATYHVNVHCNGMKLATMRLSTACPVNIYNALRMLQDTSKRVPFLAYTGWNPDDNVVNIEDLRACVQFYLKTIPLFLFNEDFYTNNDHKGAGYYKEIELSDNDFQSDIYIAGNIFKGIMLNNSTILTMHPTENGGYLEDTEED